MSREVPEGPHERTVGRRGRRIVVAGKAWIWRLGKAYVVAHADCGERRFAAAHEVKGVTADSWERGKWKRSSDGQLTPADVARWLSTPNAQVSGGRSESAGTGS